MPPKLNRRRAELVLNKIEAILAWEARHENLKSFDEFLERQFPESRRKAYYLMSIHEHLPPQVRKELKQVGWDEGAGVGQAGAPAGSALRKCNLAAQSSTDAQSGVPAGRRRN